MSGMAAGSWFAGMLYDFFGYYAPAFMIGVVFNVANLLIIGFLVLHFPRGCERPAGPPYIWGVTSDMSGEE